LSLALAHPQRGAADDRGGLLVRRAPVRQLTGAPVELEVLGEAGNERGGLDVHGAVAVDELRVGGAGAAAIGVNVVLLPGVQRADVLLAKLLVDQELDALDGVEAIVL